jgi:putative spermidine/putrescine transport system substrate-binding protein
MPHRISRRSLLRHGGVALGAIPILGACARADDPSTAASEPATRPATEPGTEPATEPATPPAGGGDFEGEAVTLLVYSGLTEQLYRDHFVPQFQAATGAVVTIDSAWTEGIARLDAAPSGSPPFDLVLTDPTQGLPAAEQGLFQQFDTARVPNAAANFHPNLLDTTIYTEGFGIPFHSSAMTLATNTDLEPEPFTTWGELFDRTPERGFMLYNLPYMSLYTFAEVLAEREGLAPGSGAALLEDDLEAVLAFAAENGDRVAYYWPSTADGVNALVNGDVAAGNMHGNGLLAPAKDGAPVSGTIPPGTDAYVQLFFSVPTGVRNLDLSLAALDHICSREFQQALAESGEYSCAVPDIAEAYAATDDAWAAAFPASAADFESLRYYPYDVYAANADRIAEVWDGQVLR